MGHTLAMMFESAARILHQLIDSVPERIFDLISAVVLIAVGLRLRRTFE